MENEIVHSNGQTITLKDRKTCDIDGVKKVDSFDQNEFLVDTTLGFLHVKGKDLSLGSMNMDKGTLTIIGEIDSINYVDKTMNKKKEGFVSKLFK